MDGPVALHALEALGFRVRDVRPEDREEVLALTAATWAAGDYIHWVFDDWLSDRSGRFLAAQDAQSGRIAAIDKLSFLSPAKAWFGVLRVHPGSVDVGLPGTWSDICSPKRDGWGRERCAF